MSQHDPYQQSRPSYPQAGQYAPAPGVAPLSPATERQLMMAAHWSAIASAALVGLTFLGPLVVLLGWGKRSPAVRRQAVDALNFQITTWIVTAALVVVGLLTLIFVVGFALLWAAGFVWIVALVFHAVATIRVAGGESYRYPFTLHLIK